MPKGRARENPDLTRQDASTDSSLRGGQVAEYRPDLSSVKDPKTAHALRTAFDYVYALRGAMPPADDEKDIPSISLPVANPFTPAPTPAAEGAAPFDYIIAARFNVPTTTTAQAIIPNQTSVFYWPLPFDFTVSKLVIENIGVSAGNFFSGGIYSSSGSLLVDSGPQSLAVASKKSVTLASSVDLPAGNYYVAWTGDIAVNISTLNYLLVIQDMLNLNKVRVGFGNASVAGQLPATLGSITIAAALYLPIHMLLER